MFDIKALENDQIFKWNINRDHDKHLRKLEEIEKSHSNFEDPTLVTHMNHLRNAKLCAKKMEQLQKNASINRTNQLLFEKIIEISSGKTEEVFKKNVSISGSTLLLEPTLHYFYRKKEADRISEENETLAKRIIQQPSTLKLEKMKKDIDKYLVIRHQMQRFKSYFADPPKKKKFKKTKHFLPPINQLKNIENNVVNEESVEKNEAIDGIDSIMNNTTTEEKKAEDPKKNQETSYLNTTENNNDKNKPGVLIISPKNGHLSLTGDLVHEMETLIRVKLWDQTTKSETSKLKGMSPIWNQNLLINKKRDVSYASNLIQIEIWQNDEWNANNFLGNADLNLDEIEIFKKKKFSKWLEMKNQDKIIGKVLINLEWKWQTNEKKNVERTLSPQMQKKKIKETEDKIAKGLENKQNILNTKKSGILLIRPKEAQYVTPASLDSRSYVKVSMGNENLQSQLSTESIPKWIQTLPLKRKMNENEIKIEVNSKESNIEEIIGKIDLDLIKTGILLEKISEKWLEILKEGKVVGKILIEFEWKPIDVSKNKKN